MLWSPLGGEFGAYNVLASRNFGPKKSLPSTAVKMFFQVLEDATTLERQDWALECQVLLVLDSARRACKRQASLRLALEHQDWALERHSFHNILISQNYFQA